ncbi:YbaB/EbfC family nucleoid-associated protein [Brachyspira hyodysenteriae]|uniref:YbaB/EbfC family nucleoid-associated protein n=1 Tax=Brachyspira hyodysenteriae TaxID=159 RepID=UPI00063DC073|nr:YbaB/EbfC family nucleoid-associated protein [Brachyspira hyodysenteriae]KLI43288.1 valyl-tRNA synthetase [Brachyspira hyodysenteriae]MCZ9851876.1 YbaB/EbfC family nucleoid-associated protein [Brachyspira hyodysenteriae]MCZ9859386.1 YbaB/EbfC family nucleoid-associated protein [Brachyspira hyodysenteriae]MCZ9893711.1 YbaB/EbfC family nucleoid-associated protein [Brachyspira hyodysenteriae]MCZ9915836.1 YbaB/EbfC family nucleoid-associated protein [Brachyspira hyodysenteriae]
MSENSIKYSSAGNLVSLTMNKSYNITSFSIDETLLAKDQKELLEEMISSSINEAVSKVNELRKKLEEEDSDIDREQVKPQPNLFNMNFKDMNQMFNDISKMTSVEYKDGKINISLDSITPDMISKMNDMMNNMNNKNDDDNKKE